MGNVITFEVVGTPKGQPRARAFARKMGNKFVARVYDAGTAEGWKSLIALAARPHVPATPIDGPVRVDALWLFPRPQRLLKKKSPAERIPHTAKPDRDNLDKASLDCLTTLGFWKDDAQVYGGTLDKFYVAVHEKPGAMFTVHFSAPTGG